MALNVLSFEDALGDSEKYSKRHLLLGNGFSIACEPNIFAYGSLFEEAKKKMSPELAAIFSAMETQDFEIVIRALQNSASILGVYLPKLERAKSKLLTDASQLKSDLISAVAGTHPARPFDVPDSKVAACREFLSNFIGGNQDGKVYTFNYDLLLYWALMRDEAEDGNNLGELHHDDGFRKDPDDLDAGYVEWQGEGAAHKQNIHYLHGALHLFDAGHQLQKYTWINTGIALVDQANEALQRNAFPLFVAEGESKSKLQKIMHSAYLHHNLKSFHSICGQRSKAGKCLFVFGHSFAENDAHILNKIGYGQIDWLYVSLFGDPESEGNKEIRNNVSKIEALRGDHRNALGVTFFDAASAKVWG